MASKKYPLFKQGGKAVFAKSTGFSLWSKFNPNNEAMEVVSVKGFKIDGIQANQMVLLELNGKQKEFSNGVLEKVK